LGRFAGGPSRPQIAHFSTLRLLAFARQHFSISAFWLR
jgi:hypothetical protein